MKDDELKNIWNMINEESGIPGSGNFTADQFITNRSGSIQEKIRKMLQNNLIIKLVSATAFILNLLFYQDTPDVVYVCIAGLIFVSTMAGIEFKTLQQFNRIADQGLPTRDSLSGILVFLRRKSNIFGLTLASTQILIFVPGLLLYFYLVYGYLKPMTGISFMVYSVLCLIGTIMAYAKAMSQLKFHIKHITVCLSDLNDNSLSITSSFIEKQRKQDERNKVLLGLLLIFAFVAFIAALKSLVG